ncbi:MAG: hypothetical protein BK997_03825 [Candidatus Micrarchaeum sp. ARMAN-1]|jgi:hypothetical protein|nr:MAG: hypothetical protein BK997_03825 [Candidatus Micrarchaeum sp. ARMAN-1]
MGVTRLEFLLNKLRARTASSTEIKEFLDIIQANAPYSLNSYILASGFSSYGELLKHLQEKGSQEDREKAAIGGLIIVGLAVLAALLKKE